MSEEDIPGQLGFDGTEVARTQPVKSKLLGEPITANIVALEYKARVRSMHLTRTRGGRDTDIYEHEYAKGVADALAWVLGMPGANQPDIVSMGV